MLSPNDLANIKFDRCMGRGYKMEEVDTFIAQVRDLVRAQEDDRQELENKMLVLADKLEEYKKDEDNLRSAIMGAQRLANSVMQEAKDKAKAIVDEANNKAAALVDNARKTIEQEENRYVRMKREVATFKSKLQHMYKQHLELISNIPSEPLDAATGDGVPAQAAPMQEQAVVPDVVDDIANAPLPQDTEMQHIDQDIPEAERNFSYPDEFVTNEIQIPSGTDNREAEIDDDYDSDDVYGASHRDNGPARRESRYGTLKFGKEFDIKRDGGRRKK